MKLRAILFSALLTFFAIGANAQCPGCAITSCGAWLPDGGICDTLLPDGMANHAYDTDISFFMPSPVSDPSAPCPVELDRIEITGMSGLPLGLSWESNKATNEYFPHGGESDGCVKICGTPIQSGTFPITVYLLADVTVPCLSVSLANQPQEYNTTVTILPDTNGGVSSFTILPNISKACGSLDLAFDAVIDATPNITTYNWNFGNGNTATGKTPPGTQNYSGVGTYDVVLETVVYDYYVTQIDVDDVTGGYCGDIEETFCNCGTPIIGTCPELYAKINAVGFQTATASSDDNASWTGLSVTLPAGTDTASLQVWDEDGSIAPGFSADDLLAEVTFMFSIGAVPFSGANGVTGTIYIDTVRSSTLVETLQVEIAPALPAYNTVADKDSFCVNDSVTLTLDASIAGFGVQWYKDSVLIPGATDSFYVAYSGGKYYVEIVEPTVGCFGYSTIKELSLFSSPPGNVTVIYFAAGQLANTNFPGGNFSIQWYKDGVLMPGETNQVLNHTGDGSYTAVVSNNSFPDCSSESSPFVMTGVEDILDNAINGVSVYPNPTNGQFTLAFDAVVDGQDITVRIVDLVGKVLHTESLNNFNGQYNKNFNYNDLAKGIYTIEIKSNYKTITKKVIIQ